MPKEQVFDFYIFNQYFLINRYSICWFSDSVMLFKQQDPFDISKGSKFIILMKEQITQIAQSTMAGLTL